MSDYFLSALRGIRDEAAKAASGMGMPQVRSLVLRKRAASGEPEYVQILPNPVIVQENPESDSIDGLRSVRPTSIRYRASGISRAYTRTEVEQDTYDFFLDGTVDAYGQLVGGKECLLVSVDDSKELTWDLILEEKLGERSFYS